VSTKPSYLGAFLKHPSNRVALLAAGVVGIFASIPLGWAGLAAVGVVTLGTEVLAALAIPSLPSFQASVDRQQHQQARAQRRLQLLTEISNYGDTRALDIYQHMASRVQALYRTADDKRSTLTRADVDKLEDLTIDYLGLSAVSLSLKQRKDSASEDTITKRISSIQAQLQNTTLPENEERQLRGALAEYTEVLQRSRRLAARRSALEATLISLPDKMEEVYQLVITSPYSSDMGGKLEESLSRLRIAEEVAAEFDDFASPSATPSASSSQSTRPQTSQPVRQPAQNLRH
jgi:hypothetical protein